MKKQIIFSTILALSVILMSCGSKEEKKETVVVEQKTAPVVTTVKAEKTTKGLNLTFSGNLEASEQVFVSAQAGTRISSISVDEGQKVRKGQTLVRMEASQLTQSQIQLDQLKREMDRKEALFNTGAIALQEFENARMQYDNARSSMGQVASNTIIKAPFSGTVSARYFEPGEIYTPGGDKPSLLTIMQTHEMKIRVSIPEMYYSQVKKGKETIIEIDALDGKTFNGKIATILPTIDPETRTFKAEITIPNKSQELLPGMFTQITIPLKEVAGIYIPSSALITDPVTKKEYVFTESGGIVHKQEVTSGMRMDDVIQIEKGLQPGNNIVTQGKEKLQDSIEVVINH